MDAARNVRNMALLSLCSQSQLVHKLHTIYYTCQLISIVANMYMHSQLDMMITVVVVM